MTRLLCLVPALVLAGSAPVLAQYQRPPLPYRAAGTGTPVDALPSPYSHGGSCVRLCEYDFSPCDPDYWKVADRRCNYNQRGSY